MKMVLLGPPGAGKGTLANLLKESHGLLHISSGDLLREEMKNNTDLGQEVKNYIENGELVPDKVVTRLIEHKFTSNNRLDKGYMLDGFPRTKQQAEDLDKILSNVNKPLDYALYLESTLPVIIQRLTGRRVCRNCGALFHINNKPPKKEGVCDLCKGEVYQRADDNEETIKTRMNVYMKNTMPIIDYYKLQGKLKKVDADKDSHEVQEILMQIFNEDRKLNQH
jgi:adenylate kinase